MASRANTAFEVHVSNITRNTIQNVAGTFGSFSGSAFTGDICPSGFLVTPNSLMPNRGYEGLGASGADILNGNTWYFTAATNGAAGRLGDHTGIYAFNSYDTNKVSDNRGHIWQLGANFLGQELPANEIGTFTEIIIGEMYVFGAGNLTAAPTDSTYIYFSVANGLLTPSATAPSANTGLYFKWLGTKGFTVGTRSAGFDGYIVQALRA